MDNRIIEILSEELTETRRLADAAMQEAKAAMKQADQATRKADAAWELVVIAKNEMEERLAYMRLPIWKKWFGRNN